MEELDEEIGDLADEESNIAIQQQILDEAKKNLDKKAKKKSRAGVKKKVPNLTVEYEEETVKSQRQHPPPTSTIQPEIIINPEELKEEPVEFDITSMNFPKIFITKEDELADSLRPKKSNIGSKAKHMSGHIKKKRGNPKRYDLVGPVQLHSQSSLKIMTFRDDQGIKRFFRLKDHARNAGVDTLRAMQKKLDTKITEEVKFIEDLQREINNKLARQKRNH
ncbi:hypothetical protein ACET3Z_013399 [Daucus carota]